MFERQAAKECLRKAIFEQSRMFASQRTAAEVSIAEFNDAHSFEEVKDAFKRALELAEKEQVKS